MNIEKFFKKVIEVLPDPIFAIDKDGKIILWNSAMERLTRAKREEVLGKGDYAHSEIFYGYKRPTLIDLITMTGVKRCLFLMMREKLKR